MGAGCRGEEELRYWWSKWLFNNTDRRRLCFYLSLDWETWAHWSRVRARLVVATSFTFSEMMRVVKLLVSVGAMFFIVTG